MKLSELLNINVIKTALTGTTKQAIIEELFTLLEKYTSAVNEPKQALQAVLDREKQESTGLERGVAVPHGKTPAVNSMICALGIAQKGVNFDALDGNPTHLIFLLIAPHSQSGPHIRTLAQIAHLCNSDFFRKQLIDAQTAEQALRIIQDEEGWV